MARRGPESGTKLSRAEAVAGKVEDEILDARLPVGAHLGRRVEFMERFGISPTIMNEALRILRDRGLVGVRPGTGGGIFVASLPPQVRLGAMDLWFNEASVHPLELFEARLHLENALSPVAYDRATDADVEAMQHAVDRLAAADEARAYISAIMDLHRSLVRAAGVPVLDGMHETIVALLRSSLTRAVFMPGYEPMLKHSLDVHGGMVDAIRTRNRAAFDKILALHHEDLVRVDDPRRSPEVSS